MIKVYINKPIFGDFVDFYIVKKYELQGKTYLLQSNQGLEAFVEVKECEVNHTPSFRLSGAESTEIMKALADALDAQGIKTDADSKVEGKLEATNAHLEDMRKLVFKGK